MTGDFVKLWFSGESVPAGQLPVTAVRELAVYQDVIREVAAILWRRKSNKKRLPPHFKKAFNLAITGAIEEGSAGVQLACINFQEDMLGGHFDDAQTTVFEVLRRANLEQLSANDADYLEPISKLGAKFSDDFSMRIHPRSTDKHVRVTSHTSRRVGQFLKEMRKPREVDVVGQVFAVDRKHCTFGIDVVGGARRLKGRYDRGLLRVTDNLLEAIQEGAGYARVSAMQTGQDGELNASHVVLLGQPKPDFEARMVELIQSEDADAALADKSRKLVRSLVWDSSLPHPYMYLSADGGLRMEWTFEGPWDVSVGFEHDVIFGDATNPKTCETDDFEVGWEVSPTDLAEKVRLLLRLAGWKGRA